MTRITELAERFSPDNEWFIKTLNTVFLVAGDLVAPAVAHNLMQLIAIGPGDDEAVNEDLRRYAVAAYTKLLDRKVLLDLLTQVVCWVLGEFGHLSNEAPEELVDKMCELLERQYEHAETRSVIVSAMLKLCAYVGNGYYPPSVQEAVEKYQSSFTVDTQQRCYEFARLVKDPSLMNDVLPRDAFDEDLGVDPKMSFLNSFVEQAVANGAARYKSNAVRDLDTPTERVRPLNFEEYERPSTQADISASSSMSRTSGEAGAPPTLERVHNQLEVGQGSKGLFGAVVETKWTEDGYVPEIVAQQQQQQKQAAATSSHAPSSSGGAKKDKRNSAREKEQIVMSEKQKEAADLFQFDTDVGSAPKKSSKSSKKTKKHHKTKKEDGGDGKKSKKEKKVSSSKSSKKAAEAPAPQQPASNSSTSWMDDLGATQTTQTTPQTTANKPSQGQSLLDFDLFGGSQPSNPSQNSGQTPIPPSSTGGLDSLFDLGGGGAGASGGDTMNAPLSSSTPAQPMSAGGGMMLAPSKQAHFPSWRQVGGMENISQLPLSIDCHQSVANHPKSNNGKVQIVADDANVNVGYLKVFRPDSTMVLLYVSNKAETAHSDVRLELKIPDAFNVTFVSEPGLEGLQNGFRIAELPAFSSCICTIQLQWKKHSVNLAASGTLRLFTSRKEPRGTSFTVPLGIQDIMRAESISPQDFAQLWQSSSQEKKVTVPQSKVGQNVITLNDAVKELLNMHAVQMVGQEVRAAAILCGTEKLILVTLQAGMSLNVTVRSNDTFLTESVLKSCRALLV